MNLTPTTIFRIDGIGALVTAFCLGVLMPKFPELFHLPIEILNWLALIACLFATYSLSCSVLKPKNWQPFLKAIAIANISYCLVTAGLVLMNQGQLGLFDLIYFFGEVLVVVGLAVFELKMASSNST